MKFRLGLAIALIPVIASAASLPANAGQCTDSALTQAIREVTGRDPINSGNSGDCDINFYARNVPNMGYASSYQDLVNKVRVKKTGQGVGYVFLAPNQAGFMGHVGFGYVTDEGTYVYGGIHNGSSFATFRLDVRSSVREKEMIQQFRDWFRGQTFAGATQEYTEYRISNTPSRNVLAAYQNWSRWKTYFLFGNNCMDQTSQTLSQYGMSLPSTSWISPRIWFSQINGRWHHVNEQTRGGELTTESTRPINVQLESATPRAVSLAELSQQEGIGFVAPRNTWALPAKGSERSAALARVTQPPRTRGQAQKLVVTRGLPTAPKRQLAVANPKSLPAGYRGLGVFVPYSNEGAPDPDRASGQAAIASIVQFYKQALYNSATRPVVEIFNKYPPDIKQGIQGTSWQQMKHALSEENLTTRWYHGEAALKSAVAQNMPSIVLLDVSALPQEGWKTWGNHWTVVYAYDREGVYLSNWPGDGKCTWGAFKKAWNSDLTKAAGTANLLLCPEPIVATGKTWSAPRQAKLFLP